LQISVRKAEIQTLVAVCLSSDLVRLILDLFFRREGVPCDLLLTIEMCEVLALDNKDDEAERQDGDADLVSVLVVRRIPFPVDLVSNNTSSVL
jgi:hypothetical protein